MSSVLVAAGEAAVRFADVEEALRDRERLEWLLPVVSGDDNATADTRTAFLAAGLLQRLSGRALVDWARAQEKAATPWIGAVVGATDGEGSDAG